MKNKKKYIRNKNRSLPSYHKKKTAQKGRFEFCGTVACTRRGSYFVEPDEEYREKIGDRVFIPPHRSADAVHGDRVLALLYKEGIDEQGYKRSPEGYIKEVVSRGSYEIPALLSEVPPRKIGQRVRYRAFPVKKNYDIIIGIDADDVGDGRDGDLVLVHIEKFPKSRDAMAVGRVVRVFGPEDDYRSSYEVILAQHGVRVDFAPEVLLDADKAAKEVIDTLGRKDIRDELIFTIDSESAKDLDDAVSISRTDSGFCLGVHIADVSHYVKEGFPTDAEAFLRGTSIYFTDKVVPMLPTVLSNGACSLDAGCDRFALSAFIDLDSSGKILGCDIKRTVINSKIRGVYSELNDVCEKREESEYYSKYSILFPDTLDTFLELYGILDRRASARGMLELESAEPYIILDNDGMPVDIVARTRGLCERAIEQFMLCANEAVASWLIQKGLPGVYRIHEDPPPEGMDTFIKFAYNRGYDVSGLRQDNISSKNISRLLDLARERGEIEPVSAILLRSLAKAKYSDVCSAHFGLAIARYCHFTSPIRRYPDLSVHRIICAHLDGGHAAEYRKFAAESARQSTDCELRALSAERDIDDMYRCLFLSKFVGQEADGRVSSIISSGFFVRLDNTCEGFVPLATLDGYYSFDPDALRLCSRANTINIGDRVRVKIERVSVAERICDMELTEFYGD